MPLTDAEQTNIENVLTQAGATMRCPSCNQPGMRVGDYYAHLILRDVSSGTVHLLQENLQLHACAMLTCTNCGYTSLHQLSEIGLD